MGLLRSNETKEVTYKCDYPNCGEEFTRKPKKSKGGRHSTVSSQIECPRCGNGLPTWQGEK